MVSNRTVFEFACELLAKYQEDESIDLKDEARKLDANSKDRKKIVSLVINYMTHKDEVKKFKKETKIKCKKRNLDDKLVRMILTEILYSPCFKESMFEGWEEWSFLSEFIEQINEKKKTIVLRELPAKQEKKRKNEQNEESNDLNNKLNDQSQNQSYNETSKKSRKRLRKQNHDHLDLFKDVKVLPVKYLRVNKIKTTIDELIDELVNELKFVQVGRRFDCFNDFLKKLFNLKSNEFMVDYHFPDDLIVINSDCKKVFQEYRMYQDGRIIFQDKASLIPLKCANLEKGMRIADICCCPGMKTFGISSALQNDCQIISIDVDPTRIETMKELMDKLAVKCTKIIEKDFTETTIQDFEFEGGTEIDVLFLDPSCSGSGMIDKRIENDEQKSEAEDKQRLMKLASFQTKLLSHAMSLKPKLIVYSTCSFSVWENEFVICKTEQQAINAGDYELIEAFSEWPQRGDHHFTCARQVLRSGPSRGSRGFFTAVFRLRS